jgi:hypothetical protein
MKPAFLFLFTFFLMTGGAFAHGGEDHGGGTPAPTKSGMTAQVATGDDVEALFKYAAPAIGRESRLFIFVTDKRANTPVTGLEVAISLTDPSGKEIKLSAKAGELPGQYECVFTPNVEGQFRVRAGLTGKAFTEGFAFAPLVIAAPPAAKPTEAPPVWLLVLSGGLVALAAFLVFGPRRQPFDKQTLPQTF